MHLTGNLTGLDENIWISQRATERKRNHVKHFGDRIHIPNRSTNKSTKRSHKSMQLTLCSRHGHHLNARTNRLSFDLDRNNNNIHFNFQPIIDINTILSAYKCQKYESIELHKYSDKIAHNEIQHQSDWKMLVYKTNADNSFHFVIPSLFFIFLGSSSNSKVNGEFLRSRLVQIAQISQRTTFGVRNTSFWSKLHYFEKFEHKASGLAENRD